jgi:hypothetical protein
MMGVAFDNTCLLWQPLACSTSHGSCSFYDSKALSINFVILLSSVSGISFFSMLIANVMYRHVDIVEPITLEVTSKENTKDGISEDQKEAIEVKCVPEDKTKECTDSTTTDVWTLDEKPIIHPSDVVNLGFVHDDNLEMSQL